MSANHSKRLTLLNRREKAVSFASTEERVLSGEAKRTILLPPFSMDMDNQAPPQDQTEEGASTTTSIAVDVEQTQDASHVITTTESLKAVSQELAEEFSVESLTTPAVKSAL